jgi:signal transduction histidine kinase/DNA-binding NarL/FixJ family response regulator
MSDGRQEQLLADLRREAEAARAAGDMPVAAFGYAEAIKLLPPQGADALAYELRLARAECLHAAGDYAAELDEVERLEVLGQRLGAPELQSAARLRKAAILGLGGDAPAGRALAMDALKAAQASRDSALTAAALLTLAGLAYSVSDYVASAAEAEQALALCRSLGDQRGEAQALRLHGLATLNSERLDAARAELEASLALARAIGDRAAEALALNAIGIGSADLAQARFVYRQALTLVETLGDRESEATIANNLGIVYAALGLYGQARQYASRAVRLARAIGALELIATCLETFGRALVGLGQVAQARTALREAHTLASNGGNRHTAAICLLGLACADLAEGDADSAVAWLDEASQTFGAIDAPAELAHALAWRAAAELALGAPELARGHARQAVELLQAGHVSVEFPAQEVWWWRYATLEATEGAESQAAREALAHTWAALHSGIATLGDMGLRRSYLGRVSLNRRILEAVAGSATLPSPAPPDSQAGLQEQLTRLLTVAAGMNELHAAAALRELFLDEVAELTGADRILFVVGASPHEPAALLERGAAPAELPALIAAARPLLHEATRRRRGLLREQLTEPEAPPDALGSRSALAVPLISGAQVVGSLYAEVPGRIGPFTSGDLELVSLLATQAATALENGRLYEQARRARADLERLVDERTADLRAANKALERRAAEAQAMRASAEAASAAKSIFLANVSHELRTPLNAVIGFAQLLSRDEAMGPRQRELAQIIGRSGEHLLGMFNDVLELSRVEAGRLTISPAPFDLRRLLDDVSALFQMRAEAKGLRFAVELAPELPRYLVGDEGRLRQVLINLISNAVKFTHAGAVTVRADAQREAGHVRLIITVEDSGEGLRPEELATLFQPFAQTASGRGAQEGSGLGLALSRQLARLMGGDIRVQSTPGAGTIFTCEALLDTAAEPSAGEAAQRPARLVTNGRRYKALVAEEHWQQRRLLAAWLSEAGMEVREALDGAEAVAIWAQWRPHVTLLAADLPPVDGAETARQIKSSPAGRSTVILGLAAEGRQGRAADFDDLLAGPVAHEELLERIANHLGLDLRPAAEAGAAPPPALRAADLMALPPELRAELARAAAESDPGMVDAAVADIAASWPTVGARLAVLAAEFQFEIIEALARDL